MEEKVNDVTYRIRVTKTDSKVVHYDHLKPYLSREAPEWALSLQDKLRKKKSD